MSCTNRHNYSRITHLDLSQQDLTEIPDSVFEMSNLTHLYLGNSFTSYPPLSALRESISVGPNANRIKAISPEIEKLKNLRVLVICANKLESLPEQISTLTALDTLVICNNPDLKLSAEFHKLVKLTRLKYLNIVGISMDEKSIAAIRMALPHTKVVDDMRELIEDDFGYR